MYILKCVYTHIYTHTCVYTHKKYMEGQRNVFHTLKTKWLNVCFFFFNINSETTEIWGLINYN